MKIYYCVINGGDGSASVQFFQTEEEAGKRDEEQCEGWGESSVSSIELKIEDGKTLFKTYVNEPKFERVWKEIK